MKTLSNNKKIKGYVADFSDLDQVQMMAETIKSEVPKIDVLINNAGVFKSSNPNNKIGLDMRFIVNYLAPYLLTEYLIPIVLKGTAP